MIIYNIPGTSGVYFVNKDIQKFIAIEAYIVHNKREEARRPQKEANEITKVQTEAGVFKGMKAASKMQEIDCGACRKPFMPLGQDEEKCLETVLSKSGCL